MSVTAHHTLITDEESLPPVNGTQKTEADIIVFDDGKGEDFFGDPVAFCRPLVGDREIEEVVATLKGHWLTTGPRTGTFAAKFADIAHTDTALAVSSCTAALHLALLGLKIGKGDVVFTTTLTFVSTVHVIEHVGARPILVDVDPETLNLDPVALEKAIVSVGSDERAAAIIPVHFAGLPCDMSTILDLARQYDLAVVEDAAHGIPGQLVDGRPLGQPVEDMQHCTAFSFYATKNVVTGEGGMLTASDTAMEEARLWHLHGMSRDAWKRYGNNESSWHYEVERPGFKYNMTDLQAALGLAQLDRLPDMQDRREWIVQQYDEAFASMTELELPAHPPADNEHSWHLYVIRLMLDQLGIDRDTFIDQLTELGIGTSVHFIPVHKHRYYRDNYDFKDEDLPVATAVFDRIISLPLYPAMTDADVETVIRAVRHVIDANRT